MESIYGMFLFFKDEKKGKKDIFLHLSWSTMKECWEFVRSKVRTDAHQTRDLCVWMYTTYDAERNYINKKSKDNQKKMWIVFVISNKKGNK